MVDGARIFPLLPVGLADLQSLVDDQISKWEPLAGGFTNTLHKVTLANAKILVVDDSPDNIELMEEILREEGYTDVSSTMLPEQVCPLHREHNYDLILLDLQMPGLNGFQVMKAIGPFAHNPQSQVDLAIGKYDHV